MAPGAAIDHFGCWEESLNPVLSEKLVKPLRRSGLQFFQAGMANLLLIPGRSFCKFHAPKSRRWTQKLNPHALAPLPRIAQKYDAAFQLFVRIRICEHQHLSLLDFVLQQEQPAMGIHHHGFAHFPESPPVEVSPCGLDSHLVKHAPAAPWRGESDLAHAVHLQTARKYASTEPLDRCSATARSIR
jgi:hypothetical protein